MLVNFTHFLTDSLSLTFFEHNSIIFFTGIEYPALFFTQLRLLLKKNMSITYIDIKEDDIFLIKHKLSTSFLGERLIYFVGGIEGDSNEKNKDFFLFLKTYQGPHTVILYVTTEQFALYDHKNWLSIALPDKVDKMLFCSLLAWCSIVLTKGIKKSIDQLFNYSEFLTLESAFILMRYLCLGIQESVFFAWWVPYLITAEQSLFSLSQHLFKKERNKFFIQMHQLINGYSDQFWVVFWSDQLWRASMVVDLNKQRKYTEARKIAFRLPFSFVNQDWRNYTIQELVNAHDYIVTLDYRFKTTGTSVGFDFFYSQFLSGQFK